MEEVILAVVAPLIATLITMLRVWFKTRITPERLSTVNQLARVAVEAADEVGRATDGISPGEKFTYAESFLREAAQRVGVKLSNQEANAFIHAILNGKRDEVERQVDAILNDIIDTSELVDLPEVSAEQ